MASFLIHLNQHCLHSVSSFQLFSPSPRSPGLFLSHLWAWFASCVQFWGFYITVCFLRQLLLCMVIWFYPIRLHVFFLILRNRCAATLIIFVTLYISSSLWFQTSFFMTSVLLCDFQWAPVSQSEKRPFRCHGTNTIFPKQSRLYKHICIRQLSYRMAHYQLILAANNDHYQLIWLLFLINLRW